MVCTTILLDTWLQVKQLKKAAQLETLGLLAVHLIKHQEAYLGEVPEQFITWNQVVDTAPQVDSCQQDLNRWWPVQNIVYDFSFPKQVNWLAQNFEHKFLSLTTTLQETLLPGKVAILHGAQAETSELIFDNFYFRFPWVYGEERLKHISIDAAQVASQNFQIQVWVYFVLHERELNNNRPLIVENVLQNWGFKLAQHDLGLLFFLLWLWKVFFKVAFEDILIQFDLTSLPQGIFCCILNWLKSALDEFWGFLLVSILLDCPHLLRVHNWCFGSGAGSKLGCLVHDVLVVFLFDCKLPHIRTDRDGRYVVDNFLDVLDELTCGLIVRLTLVNCAQIFPTPWCAHRCCLKLY